MTGATDAPRSVAASARQKAGLSLSEAAQQARVTQTYLRRVERLGGCSYGLAVRLARLYRCSANLFLYTNQGSETPEIKPETKSAVK